jgi:class 3 adenylate cyclase/tetratricopeptide (TPR) repeat protein
MTPRAAEVRKTVTVVFADITGSTSLGERLDVESFRKVIGRYFDLARTCLERHGGTLEKFIGDAVVAVFGIPAVHEDDAVRAVRAAVELRDSLAALNAQLEREYGVSLQVRIGVNTGEVITDEDQLATGDAMNVAARLEQAARPGEILIGEATLELARGAVEVERLDPLVLKGKAQALVAYRLLGVRAGAGGFARRLDTPLVGRAEELTRLRQTFDEAVLDRHCRLVSVIGQPGIGKSRLAREFAVAVADAATVLSGRCLSYGEGITYWPLVEIFRNAGAEHELDRALAAGASEEIFWSVRKSLERQARQRPVALIVEDIHWAEPTLLDLIEHLHHWTRDAPLLLLCLARPELTSMRPAWSGDRLTLQPLSGRECDRMIETLSGGPVDGRIRERIQDVADGNPLFVEQMLAMLAGDGETETVPATMRALLAARIDALPEDERDVLERGAVVGLEFEWEALTELAPGRQRPSGAQLAGLVHKEFIRLHETLEDVFCFEHILLRDAAYERVPKAQRSDLHERAANWLAGRGDEFDEIVGYHLEQAHRYLAELTPTGARAGQLADRAASRLAASGARAYGRGDAPAATSLLRRAVALYRPDEPRRLRMLPALGRALIELGDTQQADSVLSEAVARARAGGQAAVATDASVALAALRLHTDPEAIGGHNAVWSQLEAAIPFFEQSGDKAALAHALGVSGSLRFWRGEATSAGSDLERAARLAREAGEWAEEAESLQGLLMVLLLGPTPVAQARARVDELGAIARRNRLLRVHVLRVDALLQAMLGSFASARDSIAQAKELARELGLHLTLARVAVQSGPIELLAGDPAAAERELRPAYDALVQMQYWGYMTSLAPRLVDALLAMGRDEEGSSLADMAAQKATPEDIDAQAGWRRVRAKLLARRGESHEADRLAREAVDIAERTDYLDLRAQVHADLSEVLHLAGRSDESALMLHKALHLHEQKGNLAAAAQLRGRLAVQPEA